MDEIHRKLAQIDKRLLGFGGLSRSIVDSSPFIFVAAGLIFGIILQNSLPLPTLVWLILLLVFFGLTAIVSCFVWTSAHCEKTMNPVSAALGVMLCAVCLGAIRLISYQYTAPNNINNLFDEQWTLATIRGFIVTEPYTSYDSDWKFIRFSYNDPSTSFYLKLTEAETTRGWAKVTGIVRVQVNEPILDLNIGDRIEAYCRLSRFKAASNPGQFRIIDYMARRNVYIAANIKSSDAVTVLAHGDSGAFVKLKRRIRQIAARAVLSDADFEKNNAGLLEALLLGRRGNIDAKTYRTFEKTGLLHFISLSGLHLGILAAVVWWFCRMFGLLKRARAVVCIAVVALFLMVVPPRAPTVRAAIICFVFCLAEIFRRRPEPVNSLSLAAVILLLMRPTNLFNVGWQLSFASVLGILLFSPMLYGFLKDKLIPQSLRQSWLMKLWSSALAVFSTGFTAWLGGAGILLYYFYTINPLTSIWTVIVFPLIAVVLILGFLKAVVWFLLPTLSAGLALVLQWLSNALIWAVDMLSRVEFGRLLVGKVSLPVVTGYYILLIALGWVLWQNSRIKKVVIVITILLVISFVGAVELNDWWQNELVLTCLDIGHGQAVVLQRPKHCFIFDAGSQYNRDIGRRIVRPFLRHEGIDSIDAIIISHDDVDHINGIPEIVADHKIKGVYATRAFTKKAEDYGAARYLNYCLNNEDVKIELLPEKLETVNDTAVKILWPDVNTSLNDSLSDNDKSVVSLITFAGKRILICSDIESYAQQKLFERFENLSADVVIAPHHGSLNTMSENFLERLGAEYVICSCGRRQYQKLQNVDRNVEEEWFYTYHHGAVTVKIDRKGRIIVHGFKSTN